MADHVLYSCYNGLTGETRIARSWFGRERLQVQYRQIDEMLTGEQRVSLLWKDADLDDRFEIFRKRVGQRSGMNRHDPSYPPPPPRAPRVSAG